MSTLTTFIQYSIRSPSHSNQTRIRNKEIQTGKEVQLSLFANDIILYIQNPKDPIKKLLKLINKYSKVLGYKINIQKSSAFLSTDNNLAEREIKKTIPFTMASKIIKYLVINLTKEVQDLYTENYKTLFKEIKEDINKWEDSLCSWIGTLYY